MEAGKQSDEIKVDVHISLVKMLHAKWTAKFYDYVRHKPQLIKNGWRESHIINRLNEKINLDPFAWKTVL